jgi:hypothetical protein
MNEDRIPLDPIARMTFFLLQQETRFPGHDRLYRDVREVSNWLKTKGIHCDVELGET